MELPQEAKQRYFELFSNAFSPSKARPAYIAEMKAKLGDEEWIKILAKRSMMTFTNQIKALALFNDFSKPN